MLSVVRVLAVLPLCAALLSPTIARAAALLGASSATVDYFEVGSQGDLSTFDALVDRVQGVTIIGPARINFAVGFPLDDPGAPGGGFDVVDFGVVSMTGELLLTGEAETIVSHLKVLDLNFGSITGSLSPTFGPRLQMRITFAQDMSPDVLTALVPGMSYATGIEIRRISEVPLPMAGLCVVTGLAALGGIRRRRQPCR